MRQFIFILLILVSPIFSFSQEITDLDFISPFHEGLAAIKKDNTWGFIDSKGTLVIDFRTDLVPKEINGEYYPIFSSGRCLIQTEEEGITYFGYIDQTGQTAIAPKFLNATHFNDGLAIIIKLFKDTLGQNNLLDKSMITYKYLELAINPDGETIHYLFDEPTHITLSKDFMNGPPEIKTMILSRSLFAIKNENNTWSLKKV